MSSTKPRPHAKEPLGELEFALHRVLTHVILATDLLYSSRLHRFFGSPAVQTILLGLCAATILFYCIYTTTRGRFLIPILAAGYVVLVFHQLSVFAGKLWLPVNPNAFFQFIWLLSFVPFAGICLSGGRRYLLTCLAYYGTAYCAIFSVLALMQFAGMLPSMAIEGLLLKDVERGVRLYFYIGVGSFTYFYWLVQCRTKITPWNLIFLGIAIAASVLSLSRVYLLIVLGVTALFIWQPKPAAITIAARVLLFGGSIFVLSGMIDPLINPFDLFSGDSSGSYRAMEYDIVRERIEMDPLRGFGLSPLMELTRPFLGPNAIYGADLGSLGVWFDFGLVGLVLYFIVLWVCSRPPRSLSVEHGWPLFLTGAMMTAYGCISPMATADGGATITGLIIGIGLTSSASPAGGNGHKQLLYPAADRIAM